ncbi:MAG TPA: glycosyltransferase [Selenomonadales bacterium]|nr:glycosyltransferase [Selenomonadales bacterium]
MRICVVSAFEADSCLAHAINTIKMAEGFAKAGHAVTVICRETADGKHDAQELISQYGLRQIINLNWIQLPHKCGDWKFSWLALYRIFKLRPDVIFARNYIVPFLTSVLGMPTIVESHAHPANNTALFKLMVYGCRFSCMKALVTISRVLADNFIVKGVPENKITIKPDAVDLELFMRPAQLPPAPYERSKPIAIYAGHLYDYKGIPTVIQAAKLLPEVEFHFIGGLPQDLERQQARTAELGVENVVFHGLKPHSIIPRYLWHADVLLLPPSQHHPSARWTSPVKLGEYLASGVPVVASSIPALKDWLTENEVAFFEPDNAHSLAAVVVKVLGDTKYAQALRENAKEKALSLSYEKRAQALLDEFILSK